MLSRICAEGSEVLMETLTLHNTSNESVAYRVRVSVPNLFVLQSSEGVLDPAQKLSVPVVLKAFPAMSSDEEEVAIAKFAVECLECDDDYYIMGAKAFWKTHSDKAVRSAVYSKAIKAAAESEVDLDEVVEVSPEVLHFSAANDDPLQGMIEIRNRGPTSVIFRIRVSVPNLFVLQSSEGVLDPAQKLSIPVVLKAFPSGADGGGDPASPLAKFAIEFLEFSDNSYYMSGAKAFWKENASSIVIKKLICMATMRPESQESRAGVAAAASVEDSFEVGPSCLVFRGMQIYIALVFIVRH
jgi:hypothetical protein